jgi:hypothetical protein
MNRRSKNNQEINGNLTAGSGSNSTPIEGLLRSASEWEPDSAAPDGLAYRAMERLGRQTAQERRPLFPRFSMALVGGVGMAATCAAAAFTVFLMKPMDEVPVALTEPVSTPAATGTLTPVNEPVNEPEDEAPADKTVQQKPVAMEKIKAPQAARRDVAEAVETPSNSRRRSWRGQRYRNASATSAPRREKPTEPTLPKNKPAAAEKTAAAQQSAPKPKPTMIALDEPQVIVPVVIMEPSEDGTKMNMTPAVVASAAQDFISLE